MKSLSFGLLLLFAFSFSSCLQDPITGPEVFSRVVTAPQGVRFFSPPASWNKINSQNGAAGDMTIRWNHSRTDTQLNFKAYYIQLFRRTADTNVTYTLFQTLQVLKVLNVIDTMVTLPNIPFGHYKVQVSGVQNADSIIRSTDTANYFNLFDPRWLDNPTNLEATSTDIANVNLRWTLPASDTIAGLMEYAIYAQDTAAVKRHVPPDSGHIIATVQPNINIANVFLPVASTGTGTVNPQQQRPWKFWVKSIRLDSAEFFKDSSIVTWAGAQHLGVAKVDTSTIDTSRAFHYSIFVGSANGGYAIVDDTLNRIGQLKIDITNNMVTLTPENGAKLLNHIDYDSSLAAHYYTVPFVEATVTSLGYAFTTAPVTLPPTKPGFGAILYLEIIDPTFSRPEYARIFIPQQRNGTYIFNNSISASASFQTGKTDDGADHLWYY